MEISKEFLTEILSKKHRDDLAPSNVKNLTVEIDCSKKIELEKIETGLRSEVFKSPVLKYSLFLPGKTEKKEETICMKMYGKGKIMDSSKIVDQKDKVEREAKAMDLMSKNNAKSTVKCYSYIKNGNGLQIFMKYLGNNLLGRNFRELNNDETWVLGDIAKNQPLHISELEKRDYFHEKQADIALIELSKLGFIEEKDKKYRLTPKFNERFDFKGEGPGIQQKEDYKKSRMSFLEKGLDDLFLFSDEARNYLNIEMKANLNLPLLMADDYIERFMRKLYTSVKYDSEVLNKKDMAEKYKSDEEKIRTLYFKPANLLEKAIGNVIINDAHLENIMGYENEVKIIDLFHISQGVWLSDVVDYLLSAKLLCNISNSEYNMLLSSAYIKRNNIIEKGRCAGENEELFTKLKKILDVDRGVYYLGSASGYLLNYKKKFDKNEQRNLKIKREGYKSYAKESLNAIKDEDEQFFPKELKDIISKYIQ